MLVGGWEPPNQEESERDKKIISQMDDDTSLPSDIAKFLCGRAASTKCIYVVDLEDELERNRRLEEEFHAKLERERCVSGQDFIINSV